MNIFRVHNDPYIAAMSLVDKHVVKMILESAQLLSTAHRMLDGVEYEGKSKTGRRAKRFKLSDDKEDIIYQATHMTHPCGIWIRSSLANYNWLLDHLFGLLNEYTHRYNKEHKVLGELSYKLCAPPKNIPLFLEQTEAPSCMDKEYIISNNPVINYRNYYNKGKRHLFAYTKRNPPEWLEYDNNTKISNNIS